MDYRRCLPEQVIMCLRACLIVFSSADTNCQIVPVHERGVAQDFTILLQGCVTNKSITLANFVL